MDTNTFSVYDWLVFSSVLALSVGIGVFYAVCGGKQKSSEEYLLANRSMGFFPISMSLLASLFTGIYVQGATSDVYYRGGTVGIWGIVSQSISLWISARCFLPLFYKLELTSVYEYLEMRFNRTVQISGLIIFFVYMILYTSIATFAMGLALTAVTDLGLAETILILSAVCLLYTFLGGMKAVIWADCFQMFIVMGTLISIFIKGAKDVGGAKEVWRIATEGKRIDFFNDFIWDAAEYATFWNICFGGILGWLPAMAIAQYQVQRFNSCKDLRTGYIALSVFGVGMTFMTAACVLGGVFLYSYYAYCDPLAAGYIQLSDELVPYFIIDSFHHIPGLSGLLVAGLCSLGLSTVSSVLSALSAVTGTHIVKGLFKIKNDNVYTWSTKILVIFYSAVIVAGAFVVQQLGAIFAALLGFTGVINGPIMGVFILGVFSPRPNSMGVMIGLVLSMALGMWLLIGSLIYPPPVDLLPLSTEGCSDEVSSTMTAIITSTTPMINSTLGAVTTGAPNNWPPITNFYALSRLWYPTVITGASMVFGLIASAITGFNNPKDIDPRLICQLPQACCFFIPKQWKKWERDEKETIMPISIVKTYDGTHKEASTDNPAFVETKDV